jgi:uncharacterized protein YlzI (FlbEa/FlbD family)
MLLLAILSILMLSDINFVGKENINDLVDKIIETFEKIEKNLKK